MSGKGDCIHGNVATDCEILCECGHECVFHIGDGGECFTSETICECDEFIKMEGE